MTTVFPHSAPPLQPYHYKMTMIIISVFLYFLPPLYSFVPNRFLLLLVISTIPLKATWFQLNPVSGLVSENPGLTKEEMCFFALGTFLCFPHFCVLHISMFCTFLCFAHSPFLPRTLSGQSNRLQLPPPKTEVITNTDQNTNTDTNTNTETSRDAIKPVSTSSTLNESDPPLVVR